jgi:hypothetical protein
MASTTTSSPTLIPVEGSGTSPLHLSVYGLKFVAVTFLSRVACAGGFHSSEYSDMHKDERATRGFEEAYIQDATAQSKECATVI